MAESGPIDSLSIEIGASATKAINSINKLEESLRSLRQSLKFETGETASKLSKLAHALNKLKDAKDIKLNSKLPSQLRELGESISSITDDTIRKLGEMTAAIERLRGIDLKGFTSAVNAAKKASKEVSSIQAEAKSNLQPSAPMELVNLKPMSDADFADMLKKDFQTKETVPDMTRTVQTVKFLENAFASASKVVKKFGESLVTLARNKIKLWWDRSSFKSLEKAFGRINNIIRSFSRIAFYRAIRSAIKYVTDALKEGTENAYWYSKEFGDATKYISEAYDQMSSANFKMSNQLGAAWATLIAAIQPIILKIIELVTKAANVLTQFFAILGGKGTYMKAIDYTKDWADATAGGAKAAEEWKNQLMGFDEINRLEEPSSPSGGGGGAATPDYENMFEENPVADWVKDIKDMWTKGEFAELGQLIGNKFNEMVESVNWKGIGTKIGKNLKGVIESSYSFLKTANFKNLGAHLAELFNNAADEINFNTLGRLRIRMRTALLDILVGAVANLNWGELAKKLSDYFIGELQELTDWIQSLDPKEIAQALKDFFGNIKYTEIGQALYNLLKAATEYALGVMENLGLDPTVVKTIAAVVAGLVALIATINTVTTVVGAVKIAIGLLTSPVGLVIVAIGALVTAGVLLYKNWDTIKETANKVFGPLMDSIKLKIDGIKNVFQGLGNFIAGVFTGDWSRAWEGIKQIFYGVYEYVVAYINGMFSWLSSLINGIAEAIGWLQDLFRGINELANSNAVKIEADGSIYLTGFATGGFPEDGLFMANHGELVGQFSNGRTAVANNEQITAGIASAVYEAFMTAFSQTGGSGGSDQPIRIYLDGREIAQSTTKYQKQMARASGV